jgi:hypothetical protein
VGCLIGRRQESVEKFGKADDNLAQSAKIFWMRLRGLIDEPPPSCPNGNLVPNKQAFTPSELFFF